MSLPYRVIALAAGLIASACLVALIIVASIKEADALATTAIALAIITFIVQLIVYVAQAEQSRRENELTQKLHSELASNLADLTARAHGTEAMVTTINEKVLDKALEVTGSAKIDNLAPGFARDLAQNVTELTQRQARGSAGSTGEEEAFNSPFPMKQWQPEEDQRVTRILVSWPQAPEEVARFRSYVEGLDDPAAYMLKLFATDELANRNPTSQLAPSWFAQRGGYAEELFERGLIESFPGGALGVPMAHLTEAGREAARVFTAPDPPPSNMAEVVRAVREAAARMQSSVEAGEPPPPIPPSPHT